VLGFWERGDSTTLTNNKSIYGAEDFQGMQLRGSPSDIAIESYKQLGAEPVVIPTNELFTSFQQGVIDGMQSYYPVTVELKMYEPAKYVNETYMEYDTMGFIIGKQTFDNLSPDVQQLFLETAKSTTGLQRQANQEIIAES